MSDIGPAFAIQTMEVNKMVRIEDYAIIGDCQTAALICKDGSLDWLCLPQFDSPACFASLLGSRENGYWSILASDHVTSTSRQYKGNSMILESTFTTSQGTYCLIDFMPLDKPHNIIRIIRGIQGQVTIDMELSPRFEYGNLIPMILEKEDKISIIKGPDHLLFHANGAEVEVEDHKVKSSFTIHEGEEISFQLSWALSHEEEPKIVNCSNVMEETRAYWESWLNSCHLDDQSDHPEIVRRAVIILKAMTVRTTGSLVAAVTTSLPEELGGCRNWDYRFCWPRDAALALRAVINSTGQREEIEAWRHWIIRATAGLPSQMEILYGLDGSRSLNEREITGLKGYEGSRPVRIGNKAREQIQLDIYAAVIEVFYLADKMGLSPMPECWDLARAILSYLEKIWTDPDEGIWEVRGVKRHFVHSKVMVWDAFNLCIKAHEELGVEGPVDRWRHIRDMIKKDICENGFNREVNSFTQFYGSREVDASLLRIALTEILPIDDPRVESTIEKIEQDLLLEEGLVMRYLPNPEVEGLPEAGKRAFLLCSGWLGEVYVMQGKIEKAEKVFKKLVSIANDVGLLAEQYDPMAKRQLGNFPQAFSHIALIRLELALCKARGNDNCRP